MIDWMSFLFGAVSAIAITAVILFGVAINVVKKQQTKK
jgi:hypothetical protein